MCWLYSWMLFGNMWFTYWSACPPVRSTIYPLPTITNKCSYTIYTSLNNCQYHFPKKRSNCLDCCLARAKVHWSTIEKDNVRWKSIRKWQKINLLTQLRHKHFLNTLTTFKEKRITIVLDNALSLYPAQANQINKATFDIWASLGLEEEVVVLVRPDQSVPAHFNLAFYCKRYCLNFIIIVKIINIIKATSTCLKTIFVSLGCSTLSQLFPVFLSMPDLRRPFTYRFLSKNMYSKPKLL